MKRDLIKAAALVLALSVVGIPVIASSGAAEPVVLVAWSDEFGNQSLKRAGTSVDGTTLPAGTYRV